MGGEGSYRFVRPANAVFRAIQGSEPKRRRVAGALAPDALEVDERHADQRAGDRLERGAEVGGVAAGDAEAVDDQAEQRARRSARR